MMNYIIIILKYTQAPRLPGTQAKVPGWIRAEDSIIEDLEDLNECTFIHLILVQYL